MHEFRVISPTSCLGLVGIHPGAMKEAMSYAPHAICVDAGSLDPGPHYLGAGAPHVPRFQMKDELELLLTAACEARIPLVIGTAGGSGGRPHIRWNLEIVREVAREQGLRFKMAVIHTTLDAQYLLKRVRREKIPALQREGFLTERDVSATVEVVAQIGVEPLMKALDMGADVVLAGRACDDACFAAPALRYGFDKGMALHMGKIVECASAPAIPLPGAKNLRTPMLGILRGDDFLIRPATSDWICTPRSIASHSAYERTSPLRQDEPGGMLDFSACRFEQFDKHTTRITGSRWVPAERYCVKLEGSELAGFRSIFIAGARDPAYIRQVDKITAFARKRIQDRFAAKRLVEGKDFHVFFHVYGKNGVMGALEPEKETRSHELGIIFEVVAPTQEMASEICYFGKYGLVWNQFEGRITTAGNLAYLYSPSILDTGPVYRLRVHHLLPIEDPCMFPIEMMEVGA
jgi:hypothetical protein